MSPEKIPVEELKRSPAAIAATIVMQEFFNPNKTEEWKREAACRGSAPELFFPTTGESTEEAQKVCHTCPVEDICLAFAINKAKQDGVQGGVSERARVRMRRAARKGNLKLLTKQISVGRSEAEIIEDLEV